MKKQKEKLRRQSHLPSHQKEYSEPKLYKETKESVLRKLKDNDERNQKWYKDEERGHVLGLEESILSKWLYNLK